VPLHNYIGYQSADINMNANVEGVTIFRNNALFIVYKNLANSGKFNHNKHEDSMLATTRSERSDKYEVISLISGREIGQPAECRVS
jgi:hypothetical protein